MHIIDPDSEPGDDVEDLMRRISKRAVELPTWATANDRRHVSFGYL